MEIKIVQDVLEKNKRVAHVVRDLLGEKRWSMFNFMGSPGSGKTAVLKRLIPAFRERGIRVGVVEGDVATTNDAKQLQHLDIPIAHVSTGRLGGSCHLAANVVHGALLTIAENEMDGVFIENVGNLICTAEYDTGADYNAVVLSVTEGEDKPLKYPRMFLNTQLAIINKMDIAAAVEADVQLIKDNIARINPDLAVFEVSAKTGEGMNELCDWMARKHESVQSRFT